MFFRLSTLLAIACILSGCRESKQKSTGEKAALSVVFDLGRPICGDCCAEQVERAFEPFAGVELVEMEPGQTDFVVRLSESAPPQQELVEALVRSGARGARISPQPVASVGKRWVVAKLPGRSGAATPLR